MVETTYHSDRKYNHHLNSGVKVKRSLYYQSEREEIEPRPRMDVSQTPFRGRTIPFLWTQVCRWLGRCLSTDRGMRPTMEAVADMMEDLLDFDY